ncbi:MAG: hypothetical protein WBA59_10040 [Moheibacter sp.]
MKKLSTLFPMGKDSSGNENYNFPSTIGKRFIALNLLILLASGVLFGQNRETVTLKDEVKSVPANATKQSKENHPDLLKQNGFKPNENLKKNQSLPDPGKQPSKDSSLKNSENAHLGIHALVEEQSQVAVSDKNADQEFISSKRQSEKVKINQNQVPNQTPYNDLKNKKEDVSKRDLYSKTYDNGDGSYTALIGAGPIHYEKNGQFLDIDHKIIQNFDQTYPFVNATNLFQSYFGATSHTGLKNKTDDGELREFLNTKMYWEVNGQPNGLINSADTPIQIEGDKAYYRNIYGSIDVEFTMLSGKRELNYIIPNKAALGDIPSNAKYLVFSEDVVLPFGWTHEVTNEGILIKNALGQSVYLYSNPVSRDAASELEIENNTIYETRLIGNTLTVLSKVKAVWLVSDERAYPVMVDPTINVVPNNETNWSVSVASNGNAVTFNGQSGGFGNDYISNQYRYIRYHIKFNTSSIPAGSTINSVTGYYYFIGYGGSHSNNSRWRWASSADPTTTTGQTLYDSASTNYSPNQNTPQTTAGWFSANFNNNGISNVSNNINSQSYTTAAIKPNDNYNFGEFYVSSNHTTGNNRPYLAIDYSLAGNCSGTPSGGSVEVYAHVNDPGTSYGVYAFDYPQNPGIQYRWENRTSTNNGQTWTGWTNTTNFNSTYSAYNATAPAAGTRVEWRLAMRCTYGGSTGYTSTDTFISSECYQGDGSVLSIDDGWQITTFNNQRIANQVIVPQNSSFTIRTITMDVLAPNPVASATFKFRDSDINGLPGTVIEQFNLNSTRSIVRGTAFGYTWYRVSFDLTTPITLSQGNYWFEPLVVTSPAGWAFWAAVDTGLNETARSVNGGTTWNVNTNTGHNVFFLVGECFSCPEVTATADKYSVCEGDDVLLSATTGVGGYTYHWYIGYNSFDGSYDEDLGTGQTKTVTVDESTSYWVVATNGSGCEDYTYVTVGVTPPPTLIVMDPIESITCSNESSEINLITGGIIPETILDEKWNPVQNPWIVSTRTWGGSGPNYARWALYASGPTFHSPDNSNFAMVDSDAYGLYEMESSLITPPMSLLDYNSGTTNITLTFNHHYRKGFSSVEEAKVEVTTDGTNWTTIQSYTTTQGGATSFVPATINLNAYKGAPYFQLRFRYHAFWDYYWAIDDVNITGTNPLPTTVTWEPTSGLWRDEAKSIPYDGLHATTLYASPSTTTTYTISAKTSVGCPAETTVTVNRGDKDWISPSSTDWNIATNWNENSVPTADHCVRIPSTSHKPIIDGTTTAFAKNVIIADGGGLTIEGGGSLTVTDFFDHEGDDNEADVVIKHDGNLIQINDVANTGEITVEKNFNFSADRKQYNYVTAPVVSGRNMKTSIYTPNPTSVQVYNTGNDYFYETPGPYVSGLAYAVKESPGSGTATVAGKLMGIPFNGPLNYTLNTSGNRYNLVGNPYPSNLDIKKLYDNNTTKIESTFYFWDNTSNTLHEQQGSNYNGDHYAKFNAVSNTGTAADCSVYGTGCNKVPDQYVKVGTGFMIQAKTGTLNFTNAYRTTAGNIDFFGKPSGFDTQYDRYWLTMTSPSGTQTMMAIVYFDGGTDEFSADDTKSFQGSNSLFSILDTKQLNIQGRAPFRINDRVPLGYKAFETGTYIIQLEDSDGIFEEGQSIYLIDKLLNKTVKISDKPYKFLTRAGEFNDRFVIVYRPGNIIGTAAEISNQILFAKVDNQIVITSTIDKIAEVELFNLNSRSVYKKSDVNSNELRIDALNFNHQIVVVTVKTETGEFVTRKFVNN